MSDEFKIRISIPSDDEGFILLQCKHCGEYFKCTPNDIESDEVLNIYCPNCGLISENYLTDDVMDLAMAKARNYANDMIYNAFKDLGRNNSSKCIKLKMSKKPKQEYESPVYSSVEDLEEKQFTCCNRSAKISPLLKMSASYCPFCGVITFENE